MRGMVRGGRNDGAVLTGDAVVGDVLSGKTFYNTDALTKLTGTSTAKQFASGTINWSSTTVNLIVSGLSFRPSKMFLMFNQTSSPSVILYIVDLSDAQSLPYNGASNNRFVHARFGSSITGNNGSTTNYITNDGCSVDYNVLGDRSYAQNQWVYFAVGA